MSIVVISSFSVMDPLGIHFMCFLTPISTKPVACYKYKVVFIGPQRYCGHDILKKTE